MPRQYLESPFERIGEFCRESLFAVSWSLEKKLDTHDGFRRDAGNNRRDACSTRVKISRKVSEADAT